MELFQRLARLVDAAAPDVCSQRSLSLREFIYRARTPRGTCPVLKVAITNACERNCLYCAFRKDRDARRIGLGPGELARAFMELRSKGLVEGIFITSGVAGGPVRSMDRLLATAEILRGKMRFRGYLHIKIMPGAEEAQIQRAVELASRVSVNLEAPNRKRLSLLSPDKSFDRELAEGVYRIRDAIRKTGRKIGQTTQFVVGPGGETDRELLSITHRLYRNMGLKRVYYSPFRPIRNTPLEEESPENPARTRRLYQADFLLRDYGFSVEDLPLDEGGNLPWGADPKMVWARQHPDRFPVDIARADYHELILVPGIGPKTAKRLLEHRARFGLSPRDDLRGLGVILSRARPYITVKGKKKFLRSLF